MERGTTETTECLWHFHRSRNGAADECDEMCGVNGLFVNHGGHGGNIFYTNLLQLSVSSVLSVVLIGLPSGNNRARSGQYPTRR